MKQNQTKNLLVKNITFLDENFSFKINKNILINKGTLKLKSSNKYYKDCEIINGKNLIAVPSFNNAHFHLGETVFRDLAPLDSLQNYLQYTDKNSLLINTDLEYNTISMVSLAEQIKNGISLVNCARGWTAVKQSGIRGCLGYPLMKSKKLKKFYDLSIEKIKLVGRYDSQTKNNTQHILAGLWIHSLEKVDKKILKKIAELKCLENFKNRPLAIHIAETEDMTKRFKNSNKVSEITMLEKYGLLGPMTNLIHCCYVSPEDLEIIAGTRTNITLCPQSNINLKEGIPSAKKMEELGINLSIGTDGLATNPNPSLLSSLRYAKSLWGDKIDNKALFMMITINPAIASGFRKKGFIKENYLADLNLYSVNKPFSDPDKFIQYLIDQNPTPVYLIIDGNIIMKEGHIKTFDEQKEYFNFYKIRKKLIQNAKNNPAQL